MDESPRTPTSRSFDSVVISRVHGASGGGGHVSPHDAERLRLEEDHRRESNWKRWGPYLSARQWATVREDYSPDGSCWEFFPHDHARFRAYRWGEDGLLGLTDRQCRLCLAVGLWNERDPFLKERLFGLTGPQGNHGEDVKEAYFYLDATPTHSWMRALYKYPQGEFPYQRLVEEGARRTRDEPSVTPAEMGVFDDDRYFDVFIEYAKAGPDDVLIQITAQNRGPEPAPLHVLPTVWFRNTWSWGCRHEGCWIKPRLSRAAGGEVRAIHATLEPHVVSIDLSDSGDVPLWLTENETNGTALWGLPDDGRPKKDAFHDAVIRGRVERVEASAHGTKGAWHLRRTVPSGGAMRVRLRLSAESARRPQPFGAEFDEVFAARRVEADAFHAGRVPASLDDDARAVVRQAYAGLLWSKQFYHYVVRDWLEGDPAQPAPPESRRRGRNADWTHLFNRDVIAMPDTWEYPWYAAWDLAFHTVAFAPLDPDFAKSQIILMLREWYMHPSGQLPAYEFEFSDVNPPVHAWAAWRLYKLTAPRGRRDRLFLERVFHKLLINFTWWINRKDPRGRNLFSGGFLGLDNIGLFDRSQPLPGDATLEQADATAWVAFFCATMLAMALELASENPAYEDVATKFFEHFVAIADAMNSLGGTGLWDDEDGFYFDQVRTNGQSVPLKVHSMVGIIPLFCAEVLSARTIDRLPGFRRRMQWFLDNRPDLARHIATRGTGAHDWQWLLAVPSRERLVRVLAHVLDERQFLSAHGVRSLSAELRDRPYVVNIGGREYCIAYDPGESTSGMFGGNSNWRGPVWFPLNFLLLEALERYHYFYGDDLIIECPTGSGRRLTLTGVVAEIRSRLTSLFLRGEGGHRPCHGGDARFGKDPHWKDLVLFHEYFHGDTGKGLGAAHQTGWTALVAPLLLSQASRREPAVMRTK